MNNRIFTPLSIIFLTLLSLQSIAQNINNVNYQFTKTTGNYTNLSNATSTTDNSTVPIGFPFYHYGVLYNNITVSIDGNTDMTSANANNYSDLSPYLTFMDIDPNFGDSGLRYKTSGNAGSRVFVIEWRNMAIDFPGTANNSDYTNVQLAFFEGTNVIEFRYGPNVVTDLNGDFQGETGPQIYHDIIDNTTLGTRRYLLYGNPSSPTGWVDLPDGDNMTGVPANGTIYRFTPSGSTTVSDLGLSATINVFPNPASTLANLEVLAEKNMAVEIQVTDCMGRVISNQHVNLQQGKNLYNFRTADWASGVYLITIQNQELKWGSRLVKE